MLKRLAVLVAVVCVALPAIAAPASATVVPFPHGFRTEEIKTNGATYHVRVGGHGPAIIMLHGFADTGDMWQPLAKATMHDHTVIVPDLRGMGLSSHPETGYDKKSQGQDIANILKHLHIAKADLVTHDIGNMVGYAFVAQNPDMVSKWVVMDAPLPGIGNWNELLSLPMLWHFNFRGPDEERLVKGRERIYLDRFYNELSATPKSIDEATREHYAKLYARPHAMHNAFAQFGAFSQDAKDNIALADDVTLEMPVLAIGGDKSMGAGMVDIYSNVADDVTGAVIANSGHWLMEEQPTATIATIRAFLDKK